MGREERVRLFNGDFYDDVKLVSRVFTLTGRGGKLKLFLIVFIPAWISPIPS